MKITRRGSTRDHGPTTILDRKPSSVAVQRSGVVFRFNRVLHHRDSSTQHDYTVVLTRKEVKKAIGRLFDAYLDALEVIEE